jgi:hypothetical protein
MSDTEKYEYTVRKTIERPGFGGKWDSPSRRHAHELEIADFLPGQSDFRPETHLKMLYDEERLYGVFRVQDRYVRSTHTAYQSDVYEDSCVEVFLQPKPDKGYFTFEMNCCGYLLSYYIEDPAPADGRFARYTEIPWHQGHRVNVYGSFPHTVDPEIGEHVLWYLEFSVPWTYFEDYVGTLGDIPGSAWRANFQKCCFGCSHPHGASWAPVRGETFHSPDDFGTLLFEV